MTIATGVAKRVIYKKEATWGTAPGTGSAQYLRRVTSDLSLKKETYQSNEIRQDYQISDMRHGVRSIGGSINGELSAGTWKDFFAAAMRRAFAAVTAISGASITIAGAGPSYTVTRAAGSFITDGVKAGDVVRLSVGSLNAANINKNLLVLSLTATILTVIVLNGVAMVAEGPIATTTVTVIGKKTYVPITGHTDDSFSIEHYHSDLTLSELFLGCKLSQMDIALPATGLSTIKLDFLGRDITTAGAAYYVSPTAETTTGGLAAVNGALLVQGASVALLTSLSMSIKANVSGEAVVGSNIYGSIVPGRVEISGQFTALFQDATVRDYFINETEIALVAALASGTSATADFLGFSIPRLKVGGADKSDGERALIQTFPFTALYNSAGGTGTTSEQSTLVIQDSQA